MQVITSKAPTAFKLALLQVLFNILLFFIPTWLHCPKLSFLVFQFLVKHNQTREEEVICFNTDKSGRWAIDSKEDYMVACEKHFNSGVRQITWEEHDKLEKNLNCHMLALLRMMGLKDDNNGERIRHASVSTGNVIGPFYSLRKDHKTIGLGKESEGPKTRGVCGAKDCLTMRLSHTLSIILKELIPDNDTHCDSTEDLLAEIETLNNQSVIWKVGSLDTKYTEMW